MDHKQHGMLDDNSMGRYMHDDSMGEPGEGEAQGPSGTLAEVKLHLKAAMRLLMKLEGSPQDE